MKSMLRHLGQSDGMRPGLKSTYDAGCLRHIQNYTRDTGELYYVFTATRHLLDQRSANFLSLGLLFPARYSRANVFSRKEQLQNKYLENTRTHGFTLIVTFMMKNKQITIMLCKNPV